MSVDESSEQRQVALENVFTEQRQVAVNEPEGRVSEIPIPSANSTTIPQHERIPGAQNEQTERLRAITSQLQLLEMERAAIIATSHRAVSTDRPISTNTVRCYPTSSDFARETTVNAHALGATTSGARHDQLVVRPTLDHSVIGAMTDGAMADAPHPTTMTGTTARSAGRSISFAMAGGPAHHTSSGFAEETRMGHGTIPQMAYPYHWPTESPPPEPYNTRNHSGTSFRTAHNTTLNASQLSARHGLSKHLPTFSGAPEEWPMFIASFEHSTALCGYSPEENLLRLQKALKGEALEAVRYRLLVPSCLDGAIELLRTLYGRPELIVNSLVRRIRRMPPPDAEHPETLVKFCVAVLNVCASVRACGMPEYECNATLMHEIVEKLPPTERLRWNDHRLDLARVTLTDLERWLNRLVKASSLSIAFHDPHGKQNRRGQVSRLNTHTIHSSTRQDARTERQRSTATPALELPSKAKRNECPICNDGCHKMTDCTNFVRLDVERRWLIVRERGLCRRCLNRHHGRCRVHSPCGKQGCTAQHHALLHDDASEPAPIRTEKICNAHLTSKLEVLLRYIPVTVYGEKGQLDTYAFFDEESSATFVEQGLIDELGLVGTPDPLCLRWTGETERQEKDSHRLSLRVSAIGKRDQSYLMPKVHTLRSLSLPEQSITVTDLKERYSHLRGLPLSSYDRVKPRILIGIDNCLLGQPLRSAAGDRGQPVATKTRLGWTVFGQCQGTLHSGVTRGKVGSYHICACGSGGDEALDQAVRNFFTLESIGVSPANPLPSKDDKRALQLLSKETKLKGIRYETCLLWKFDDVRLPSNRAMALRRYSCLRKRMEKDETLATAVKEKMIDYETKGYIRRLSTEELEQKCARDWYLPIFPVFNVNKPGKIRMVFDAAAAVNGVSLNSYLLAGPQLLTNLLAVLYKFREFRIAVTGDIREMFHQILIRPEDQRSQLIFWNRGDEQSATPGVYAVTVMTFGAACSPSCAQYIKNLNANRFVQESPRAVECIVQEHYVDDMLASVETEEEAVALAEEVRRIHALGGFEIRNWTSNSSAVVAQLLGDQSASGLNINMGSDNHVEKVLGMWWDMTSYPVKGFPRSEKCSVP